MMFTSSQHESLVIKVDQITGHNAMVHHINIAPGSATVRSLLSTLSTLWHNLYMLNLGTHTLQLQGMIFMLLSELIMNLCGGDPGGDQLPHKIHVYSNHIPTMFIQCIYFLPLQITLILLPSLESDCGSITHHVCIDWACRKNPLELAMFFTGVALTGPVHRMGEIHVWVYWGTFFVYFFILPLFSAIFSFTHIYLP